MKREDFDRINALANPVKDEGVTIRHLREYTLALRDRYTEQITYAEAMCGQAQNLQREVDRLRRTCRHRQERIDALLKNQKASPNRAEAPSFNVTIVGDFVNVTFTSEGEEDEVQPVQ